ncbi:hypothetical protein L218DRAFT_308662 [Marasmius fiardii PR-910]|nr:hypothetical protein L218DRAFT_308662 [Marasmius fiardii PR-910]
MPQKRKQILTASDSEYESDAGRKGSLQGIQEMPLDVVYEIFNYLEPYDLLKLSRTTKTFRNIVLNRSASWIWKNARANISLPEPIPTMSEPAYINLIFERRCHFCDGPAIHNNTLIWSALVRCCKRCLTAQFVSYNEVTKKCAIYFPSALQDTLPHFRFSPLKGASEKLMNEYKDLRRDERTAWLDRRVETFGRIKKQVEACQKWVENQQDQREKELEQVREQRLAFITRKIVELGYSEMVTTFEDFSQHPLVNQRKALTERAWKKIESEIEILSASVQDKLAREIKQRRFKVLKEILKDWDQTQTGTFVTPTIWDVALWEPFKSVIGDLPLDQAGGLDPTLSIFNDAIAQLLPLVEEWNVKQTEKVLLALQKYRAEATEADLHLSTSLFRCAACSRSGPPFYAYPGILSHVCRKPSRYEPPTDFEPPEWYRIGPSGDHPGYFPSAVTTVIEVARSAVEMTKEIGELTGIDVASTPMSTMFALDPPLLHNSRPTTWRSVVTSEGRYSFKVPESDAEKIRKTPQKNFEGWSPDERYFLCKRCPSYRASLGKVKKHLTEVHRITTVSEDHLELSPVTSIDGY